MVTFILGLLIGAFLGMIVLSMCVAAKQSDRKHVVNTQAESVEESSREKN